MNSTENKQPLVTAILRSYGRPRRTRRMLDDIFSQTFSNFELLFMGDGCSHFAHLTSSQWFKDWARDFRAKGNLVYWTNQNVSHNDWGAHITNAAIKISTGKYILFLDNDDHILPTHVQHYYNSIESRSHHVPRPDFAVNKMMIHNRGNQFMLNAELKQGSAGHGSLVVRTDFLQQQPPHQPVYGQDWLLIEQMMKNGHGVVGLTPYPTYIVMSRPGSPEEGMEDDEPEAIHIPSPVKGSFISAGLVENQPAK
jgi:hypothetical protein